MPERSVSGTNRLGHFTYCVQSRPGRRRCLGWVFLSMYKTVLSGTLRSE
jgi:hypothetical protein